ncbi:radical SAM family heme chaperone HemW [Parvibaculum sp.]|uniref:radical SAM family heme chaperone HemW n=1 Tax=Parvibaculum sp. TaxID=2024848 RepID=UPI001B2F17B8|nr:radical SAM family heme chaperone HemW [Parvibaculum sp.]MBO6635349.1 coproporphyrinogen III oxidase [Parvibaculum sp.]MBO6677515.1 coproporphyrinogen III oxidase [Parvibaculum sp.]MBO6906596.1 coproporphyrinogen III oxidase [Parvibaculum sp.]
MPASPDSTGVSAPPQTEGGFAVYVHWPFCQSKCPYCDFNSHVAANVDQAQWTRALLRELEHMRSLSGPRAVRSVFFGGGTPSLMLPATVEAVLSKIAALWTMEEGVEITLEANPTSVEAGRFRGYRATGVNRLSLGVQSLDDAELKFLGRLHTAEEALAAIALARDTFPRLSFDLIYARPGQTREKWEAELRAALAHAADHLSLYQLTIEPDTAFARLYEKGAFALPDDEDAAALYALTADICADRGLSAYEVSNYAAPGAQSRHNLVYWRYGDYVGVGPGAHGRVGTGTSRLATHARRMPGEWIAAVERDGHGLEAVEKISPAEQGDEMMLMGLRLEEGVSLARHERVSGTEIAPPRIEALVADGLLVRKGDIVRASADGRMVLDAVLARLLA